MKPIIFLLALTVINCSAFCQSSFHDLQYKVGNQWDEAVPLGNGMVGALIWQKENNLRFSLDRADLWDMRPMKSLHRKEFSYKWIQKKVQEKDYKPVQKYFDEPYDKEPAPSKIPGGALEFETKNWGDVQSVHLYLQNASCEVKWANGIILKTYVHATRPVGWFRFENVSTDFTPQLIAPKYQGEVRVSGDPVGGDDLSRLGYKQGSIVKKDYSITYNQEGWGGFTYQINVRWKKTGSVIEGVWSISSHYPKQKATLPAVTNTLQTLHNGYSHDFSSHTKWWSNFWSKSFITVPDSSIEKQWYLERSKFGASARRGAPPISLQAIWTADNGRLPPWKGDYHHDLNTQLSYWPAYSGNHLYDALSYLDHLDENKDNYKRYTKLFLVLMGLAFLV